jgi:putative ATP-dependent endonuclease of the OLD family
MNISRIVIQNFRNFEDFNIDFTQGFQTIIGENNIGKSNLYWAIRMVLDKDLSYNARNLEIKDFFGFKKVLAYTDQILVSIELYSKKLAEFPTFHSCKTSEQTAQITYLFAHKNRFGSVGVEPENINITDFQWRLYAGCNELEFDTIVKQASAITFRDLDGINLYYINAFRNINSDLHGSTKSLLSKYCQSRKDAKKELESVKNILRTSSTSLNQLSFIPDLAKNIQNKGLNIAGEYFSFPISISFLSNFDEDAWSQMNIFFNPKKDSNVPIQILGLGQKNILYLSLFIAELENSSQAHEINILLIEEPEAHLHPQLQKILFANLNELKTTQVLMTSHSTHIASDCNYKNLNVLFKNNRKQVKSFAPFNNDLLEERDNNFLKRYLDATRSELFFASAVVFVEGVAEQFIVPAIALQKYGFNLTEHNISVIPIYCRYFDPYLKLVQDKNLEIPVAAIIDGDNDNFEDSFTTTSVANAQKLAVTDRVLICPGRITLEADLFPDLQTNATYLKKCFENLGHTESYGNLLAATKEHPELWTGELLKRIDKTITKGRFAQELSLLIDNKFIVPANIHDAIIHMIATKNLL